MWEHELTSRPRSGTLPHSSWSCSTSEQRGGRGPTACCVRAAGAGPAAHCGPDGRCPWVADSRRPCAVAGGCDGGGPHQHRHAVLCRAGDRSAHDRLPPQGFSAYRAPRTADGGTVGGRASASDGPLGTGYLRHRGCMASNACNGAGSLLVAAGYAAHLLAPPSVGWTAGPGRDINTGRVEASAPLMDVPVITQLQFQQSFVEYVEVRQTRQSGGFNCFTETGTQCKLCKSPLRSHRCSSWVGWVTPVVVQRQAQMVQTVQSGGAAGAVPARWWTSLRSRSDVQEFPASREMLSFSSSTRCGSCEGTQE